MWQEGQQKSEENPGGVLFRISMIPSEALLTYWPWGQGGREMLKFAWLK